MPKGKGKRPVGRPRKQRPEKQQDIPLLDTDHPFKDFFDWENDSFSEKWQPIVKRLFQCAYKARIQALKKRLELEHCVQENTTPKNFTDTSFREIVEHDLTTAALVELLEKHSEEGRFRELLAMALAFAVGEQSITIEHREHEVAYQEGKKSAEHRDTAQKRRRKTPPPESKLRELLLLKMNKHGKKTTAINQAAKEIGVSSNTLRKWIASYSISPE